MRTPISRVNLVTPSDTHLVIRSWINGLYITPFLTVARGPPCIMSIPNFQPKQICEIYTHLFRPAIWVISPHFQLGDLWAHLGTNHYP